MPIDLSSTAELPLAQPKPATLAPLEPEHRRFGDAVATRKLIYENVLKAAQAMEPISNQRYTLALGNVDYSHPGEFSIADQKAAILNRGTLGRDLRGTWTLTENDTGRVVATRKSRLGSVPYLTDRGTFIRRGNEYSLANQMRLRGGAFTRVKANGELETHVNTLPGKGLSHRVFLDPETGIFKLHIAQANIPLITLMRAMGVPDAKLREAWGNDLLAANMTKQDPRDLAKLYAKFGRGDAAADENTRKQTVADAFRAMELDPDTTQYTLGRPHKNLTEDAFLDITRKLLRVSRQEDEPDDRDALQYQTFVGPEDFLAERIRKSHNAVRQALWKATSKSSLDSFPAGVFDEALSNAFVTSGLGQPMEQVNPGEVFDQQSRITRMGEGGIPCHTADTEVFTRRGWVLWPEVTVNDELACVVNDRMVFRRPTALHSGKYSGVIFEARNRVVNYAVTPTHRMWVRKHTTVAGSAAYAASYEFVNAADVHGKRVRHCTGGFTYSGGRSQDTFIIPPAPVEGANAGTATVHPTTVPFDAWLVFLAAYLADGSCCYNTSRREYRVELGKRQSRNPLEHRIIASALDQLGCTWRYEQDRRFIISGKHIANYVRQFGKAWQKFIPDYVLTSAVASRRLFFESLTLFDRSGSSHNQLKYSSVSEQLRDQAGWLAVTLGYSVRYGVNIKDGERPCHYVVASTKTEAGVALQKRRTQYQQWQYDGMVYCATVPGGLLLTRRRGLAVWSGNSSDAVPEESRMVQPSQFGVIDFLRTPECYDRLTEVMTRRGWVYWPEVAEDDEFACLVDGQLQFARAARLIREPYKGVMYGAETNRVAYLVTPNHRLWVRPMFRGAQYRVESADVCHDSFRLVCSGGFAPYAGDSPDTFQLPAVPRLGNNQREFDAVPMPDWAELVGWWLGEGNNGYYEQQQKYRIKITQRHSANPANCDRISALLQLLPFAWNFDGKAFTITGKQLASYFTQFGYSHERYIPEYLLRAGAIARQRLYDALMLGEGRRDRRGDRTQFCTTSARLADDFMRLAFSLGKACRKVFEPDDRPQSNHGGAWVVHVHRQNEHQLLPNGYRGNDYYKLDFDDEVFSATVPGGLLYVRRGDTVGHWSGNSGSVGVDLRLASGARKGRDGKIYTSVLDTKGNRKWVTPDEMADSVVAFPGELKRPGDVVAAIVGGRNVRMVPREQVQYAMPDMESTFSPLGNMIPMKSMIKGQRAVMAARMLTQALPLINAEAPLVRSGVPGQEDRSYEEEYAAQMGALRAEQPGRVTDVSDGAVTVQYADGSTRKHELYNHFPYNRKTMLHQTPTVRPGQVVQPGSLLARSNFTNDQGEAALGLNARVAYMAHKGNNFEDAITISKSMSERLTSEHMYKNNMEFGDDHKLGKKSYVGLFPTAYKRDVLNNLDDNGVARPGVEVRKGDPLILAARARPLTQGQVHKGRKPMFIDDSVTWDHDKPGVVTDVTFGPKGANVIVKTKAGMQVGDKLSGRMGDKGVIANIVPDEEMPVLADGKPAEVLLNPLGIISRVNPAQIVETALGKIAAVTGKPYKLKDFDEIEDAVEYAQKELRKHNMTDLEDVVDPVTQRKIPQVLTGNRWFVKLHHTAESKAQGRGLGAYTAEGAPAKGGETGSKRIGMLELTSLLSHGATDVIRDVSQVRGQASPEYWAQFMSGYKPPTPKVPEVYEKFVSQLRGSGINVVRDGSQTHLMALRDRDIDEMTGGRQITSAETVDWRSGMKPKPGGLFDVKLTGGHGGKKWSYIKLHEPMPNPVMEDPIRRVLGLTKKKMEDVIAGRESIGNQTGPQAIAKALAAIDLDKEIQRAREDIKSGKRTARDAAVRKLGYLKSADRLGIHPGEWVITKAPVLPPAFRPVSTMGPKKLPMVADPNFLYKELFDANRSLADMSELLGDDVGEERLATYNALKGVTGLGDPIHPRNKERKVKGLLRHVFGTSPKFGAVQRRLLGSSVDLVGRSVITPNPDMDMDHVGIPEDKAWEIYKPFIVRTLVRRGAKRLEAARAVEERSKAAREALVAEMDARPVLINRAPTLHRYGIMAAWPRLTKASTLQISPLVVGGFGADFDGDAMNYHVPSTDEAAAEAAEKMLPSKNLLAVATFKPHYLPSQEYTGGLYEASARQDKKNRPRVFKTKQDALNAYSRGEINIDREVHILED